MDEKEFLEIKEQAARDCWDMTHANQRLSRKRYWAVTLNLTENTVPVLVAEVEELRVEQEQMRGEIKSLKTECSALITVSDEHMKEMEEFQAVVREFLKDVSEMDDSFNKGKSPNQLNLALSVSTVAPSDGRQVREDENTGFLVYQPTDPAKPRPQRVRTRRKLTRAFH